MTTVLRVRLDDAASIERLRTLTDASLTLSDRIGGPLRDFSVDDAYVDDVLAAMSELGWTLVDTDPTDAIEDAWDGMVATATLVGQVAHSRDGARLRPEVPLTGPGGWLVNDSGLLLVK